MIQATSCGGVVIFRGKILLLYKNFKNRYEGGFYQKALLKWVRSMWRLPCEKCLRNQA